MEQIEDCLYLNYGRLKILKFKTTVSFLYIMKSLN